MYREELIAIGGGSLCITHRGDPTGPLIVHLEGHRAQLISIPSNYLDALAAAGMHVVCVDNRDVGKSLRASGDYTLEAMADDVHQLIARLGAPAIVTGRSMGGAIAQLLALNYPADVAGLGLFYSYAQAEARAVRPATKAPFSSEAQFISYQLQALPQIAGSRFGLHRDDIVRLARTMWQRGVSWAGWERQRRAMEATEPWAHRLAEIDVPTVVVHGDEDPVIAPACGRELAGAIDDASFHLIAGLGHQQPAELSELFTELTLKLRR